MVNALKEIWRVLVADGCMLDWRDLPTDWPLEIVTGGQTRLAGSADASSRIPKHNAADKSLAQVVDEGWFACERQHSFDYAWYWDSLEEMRTHTEESIESQWRLRISLSEAVWTEAQRLMVESGEDARVRIRLNMAISRYRKRSLKIKTMKARE